MSFSKNLFSLFLFTKIIYLFQPNWVKVYLSQIIVFFSLCHVTADRWRRLGGLCQQWWQHWWHHCWRCHGHRGACKYQCCPRVTNPRTNVEVMWIIPVKLYVYIFIIRAIYICLISILLSMKSLCGVYWWKTEQMWSQFRVWNVW